MATDTVKQRFQLDQEISRDEGSSSWLARDREDGGAYVLKYVDPARIGSMEDLARRLGALSQPIHPALIRPYGWAASNRRVAIWRPHVDGADSASLAEAPLKSILAAAHRVAEAIHGAHTQDLPHGALKPGNVIIGASRGPCVVDFAPRAAGGVEDDIPALGKVLYEWLTGAACPPGDDDEALAARLREQLRPDLQIPPQLGRLVVAMLAADPGRRPSSMLEVRDRIDDARLLLAGSRPQALADDWAEASFLPPAAPDAPPLPAAAERRRPGRSPVALALALALMAVAIFTVVQYLPKQVAQEPAAPPAVAESTEPPPAAPAPPPTQAELEAMLERRQQAQAILDELINLQLELEEQQVEQWAERAFTSAVTRARAGDEPFREQEFEAAAAIYAEALTALEGIAALRPQVVADALARGAAALEAGDSTAAGEAFSLALAIEPDNEAASGGLDRARVLDEVMALVLEAEAAEQAGDLQTAREGYGQVLALDPATRGVAEALARVEAALVERAFRGAMSRALAALDRNDFAAARAGFERAEAIRPGTRAVADGRIELGRRQRDREIAQLTSRAATAAAQERWEAARKHYAEMLQRDENLLIAQQGLEQAVARDELDRRLNAFIAEPSKWWSDRGRSEAASLLYDARATEDPGPRLSAQIERLAQQLALAEKPVEVTLLSDQACDVVVYKIARLGRFQSTRLRLLPGRYTAVGTRDGYRDVRREFLVAAGVSPEPVSLRCEEQVFAGGP